MSAMKNLTFKQLLFVLVTMTLVCPLSYGQFAIMAGTRRHMEHSVFEELPFVDGDMSYSLGCEFRDTSGYWQVVLDYAPDLDGAEGTTNNVESVFTPQLNLLIKDKHWIGGTGVMASSIKTDEDENWTDIYWQLMFGFEITATSLHLEVLAYYPFETWDELSEFDLDDVEFGASFKYIF